MTSNTKKHYSRVIKTILSLVIMATLIIQFEVRLNAIWQQVKDWEYILAAVFIPVIIIPAISVNRWKLFLRVMGIHEVFLKLYRIFCISLFQGIILPSSQGSDILRIFYIERLHPEKRGKAGSSIVVERMLGMGLLCLFSLCALPFVATKSNGHFLIILTIIVSAGFVGAVTVIFQPRLYKLYSEKKYSYALLNSVFGYISKLHEAVIRFPYQQIFLSSILLICLQQLSSVINVCLIYRAYGYQIPLIQHLSFYPLIGILSVIPITISGFGVREGLFVMLYGLVGIPPEIAIVVSIMNYVILILIPSFIGGILFFYETFAVSQRPS